MSFTMNTYDALWQKMEQDQGAHGQGSLRRRVKPDSRFDIFLALEKPSNKRVLLLSVAESAAVGVEDLPVMKSIEVRFYRDATRARADLGLRLTDRAYEEIFSVLVEDLINTIVACPAEATAVDAFIGRLQRWQRFLARSSPDGLGEEAQRGLYAELWLLSNVLVPALGTSSAVGAWTGPGGTNQDFELPRVAIEVKATITKQPQHLSIASERQLDDTGVDLLFLCQLSLDARQGGESTLNALVDVLRGTLGEHVLAREIFEDRLFTAGYLDIHRKRYDRIGYTTRRFGVFRVTEDFPRLVEADLPIGVGNVRYSITVDRLSDFEVSKEFLERAITGTWDDEQ